MNVTIYSPLDPALIGGMRTWLESFWLPIVDSGEVSLKIVHARTRPSRAENAYRALPQAPWTVVELTGRPMPGTGARMPALRDLAGTFAGSDVVYVDNGYLFQDLAALRAAHAAGVPAVSGHHSVIVHDNASMDGLLHNAAWALFGRRFVRRFDAVHALNRADEAYLKKCGARNAAAIPLSVDRTVFTPGRKNDEFTVLFAGRLHRQKGVDRLLHFVEHYRSHRTGVQFRIAGAGAQEIALRELARRGAVTLLSGLTREEVAREMRAAHVLVAPSRTETFGFAAAEALASGTPVVCSPTHGFCDLVDGTNGTVVKQPDDPRAWTAAVDALRNDPVQYEALCRRARASTERLAFEAVSKQMLSFLSAAAMGRRPC